MQSNAKEKYIVGCLGVVQLMERVEGEDGASGVDPVLPITLFTQAWYMYRSLAKQMMWLEQKYTYKPYTFKLLQRQIGVLKTTLDPKKRPKQIRSQIYGKLWIFAFYISFYNGTYLWHSLLSWTFCYIDWTKYT